MAACIRVVNSREEQELYIPLLASVEPHRQFVEDYVCRGKLYVLEDFGRTVSASVVVPLSSQSVELSLLATDSSGNIQSYERTMVKFLFALYRTTHQRMFARMGADRNASVENLEQLGFRQVGSLPDYFPIAPHAASNRCGTLLLFQRYL